MSLSASTTGSSTHAASSTQSTPVLGMSFSNYGSSRPASASASGRGQRKLMSATLPGEYQELANAMQSKCEEGILFIFRGISVYRYWTDYPQSLTLLLAVPQTQFADEFKSQFGAVTLERFLKQCSSLPFNFPIHPLSKMQESFPEGYLPIKVRVSAAMLDKFRDKREAGNSFDDGKDKYRTDVVWDMYIVPTLYHANANIEVPGFSFRLHRVESRPALK